MTIILKNAYFIVIGHCLLIIGQATSSNWPDIHINDKEKLTLYLYALCIKLNENIIT